MKQILSILVLIVAGTTISCGQSARKSKAQAFVNSKPNSEWKKLLTANQYHIMVEKGTEPPFRNEYFKNHESGIYVSAATGEPLFSSEDKFESGTGWPSFTKPISKSAVLIIKDSDGMRQEVVERKTGLHLGHVFNDGPSDRGGMRYCMNSAALKFVKATKKLSNSK
jgi:methionine-R-sulfoxide reductase